MVFVTTENCYITCCRTEQFIIYAKIRCALYNKYNLVAIMKVEIFVERMG
jgi:hypothetical protein